MTGGGAITQPDGYDRLVEIGARKIVARACASMMRDAVPDSAKTVRTRMRMACLSSAASLGPVPSAARFVLRAAAQTTSQN